MEYLTLSSQRKRTRCCWSCSSQTSEPCNFNKFSYNFCTCCGPFRSKDAVAGNTISKPKPEKCCTKYLLVIGICWHLHFNAAPHTTPPSAEAAASAGCRVPFFFVARVACLEAGRTPFVLFPLPIHLAYARRIFCVAASPSSLSIALCFRISVCFATFCLHCLLPVVFAI